MTVEELIEKLRKHCIEIHGLSDCAVTLQFGNEEMSLKDHNILVTVNGHPRVIIGRF